MKIATKNAEDVALQHIDNTSHNTTNLLLKCCQNLEFVGFLVAPTPGIVVMERFFL